MNKIVCHLTSVHSWNDVRIFHKECFSLAKAGFDVHLVAPDVLCEKINIVQLHGVQKNTGGRLSRMTKTVYSVYRAAALINAALYHIHDPELLPVGLLLKLRGKRVIYDAHEDLPRQLHSKPWVLPSLKKPLSWLFEVFENSIARKFDAVVAATPHIASRFNQAGCRAVTINNYPMASEFELIELDRKKKRNVVCYAGGISVIRGIREMVVAVGLTDAQLFLAGTFASAALRNEITALPDWKSVEEFGQVDRRAMVEILAHSSAGLVLFHPEPNHIDAQPNKIFEYMAAGIPVIGSNFPLWKKIIEENDCGICVNPLNPDEIAKAIIWLFDHPEEANTMGANGQRIVKERYTWRQEGAKLVDLYKSLIDSNIN